MENRILKAVPELDLRVKMDALVHDLNEALKESSCPTTGKIKVGFRRRTRSAGNISLLSSKTTLSDDSVSRGKDQGQSDSDEVSANSQRRSAPYPLQKKTPYSHHPATNFESDSVNENFSPLRTGARRKRKMKRMDCEPAELTTVTPGRPPVRPCLLLPGPSAASSLPRGFSLPGLPAAASLPGPSGIRGAVKKKKIPGNKDLDSLSAAVGKRKWSNRERSAEVDVNRRASKSGRTGHAALGEQMDLDPMSSSSLSSSESDAGLQTNDEGREGDDEQSDWFADPRPDEETDLEPDDPAFQNIFHGSLDNMTSDAKKAYSERIDWLREGLAGREIRGGRRRVHDDRPGFSVLTSANEKLSRFLQDGQQLTLRLHPMEEEERDQLAHLVNMYSLRMRVEVSGRGESCPVLSKTSATPRSVRIEHGVLSTNDFKKRRKLPNQNPVMDVVWEPDSLSVSESKE